MIRSMTGFGSAEGTLEGASLAVEVRSLNHRYLKLSFKLPESWQGFEPQIEKRLRERLSRGSVNYTLRVRSRFAGGAAPVNREALRAYLQTLRELEAEADGPVSVDLASLFQLPGVCEPVEPDEAARSQREAMLLGLTDEALTALLAMREREGEALKEELLGLVEQMREQLAHVEARAPVVVTEYHDRLRTRVEALLREGGYALQEEALAREVALYAERSDIAEEIARLRSHLEQFVELCERMEPVGRTLDFLTQEMLREANTIASKSNDAQIARRVVEMKGLIDRVKEQVQNVE